MSYIRDAFAIMKSRWVEVGFLLALGILMNFYTNIGRAFRDHMGITYMVFHVLTSVFLVIIYATLSAGFLRTVYTRGNERVQLLVLATTGLYFLRRLLVFLFLFVIAYIACFLVVLSILRSLLVNQASYSFVQQIASAITMAILVKAIALVPSIIIVKDCGVFRSLKLFRHYKLLDGKGLVLLMGLVVVIPLVWVLLGGSYVAKSFQSQSLNIIPNSVSSLVWFVVSIAAVKFVAASNVSIAEGVGSLHISS